jgi:hypothetical protein
MEIFLPTLEAKMVALVAAFRFIVFAIMVAGLVFAVASPRMQGAALFTPLLKAIIIVAAIAYMDQWFPKVEEVFMDIANYIDSGYKDNPTSSADTIRESTTNNPQGQSWSWRHLNESIYQAVTRAFANIFIYVGTLITVPMLILQYVLRWLLYLLTPFALAVFMLPGFAGLGVRFLQQLLAILAWPIGFALTNLVALAVWTDFRGAVDANPQNVADALYSPLLTLMGGILATIMIIVGMITTPVVMQMLFAQGHAFTGASANPAHMIRGGASMIYGVGDRLIERRSALLAPQSLPGAPSAPPPPPPMGAEMRPGI